MYQYSESGLPYIWLKNGYETISSGDDEATAIQEVENLDSVLALAIVCGKAEITGLEVKFLRTFLDLTQRGISQIVNETEQTVSLWERRGAKAHVHERVIFTLRLHVIGEICKGIALKEAMLLARSASVRDKQNIIANYDEESESWSCNLDIEIVSARSYNASAWAAAAASGAQAQLQVMHVQTYTNVVPNEIEERKQFSKIVARSPVADRSWGHLRVVK